MNDDPCAAYRREVDQALLEWNRIPGGASEAQTSPTSDPLAETTPTMGGDLGSRFVETIGRNEAAERRYRAAIRALSECLRAHTGLSL